MRDRDQILNQFLLWGNLLDIHDHEFTVMGFAEVNEQRIGKARQPILMSEHDPLDRSFQNGIHQAQKILAFEIHAAADFGDPLIYLDIALVAKVLKDSLLVG